jgi:Putative Flp pilus-assembly TadE/G-like
MLQKQNILGRTNEQGVIITLVAVFMLCVIGAMAALSIDVVTIYTARSEAQLAADATALAGARALANSGATSDTTGGLMTSAWINAQAVALQVAEQNKVGGTNLTAAQITLPAAPGGTTTNPTVTVSVTKNNLPAFFARIWGTTQFTVGASATAEAYNPSNTSGVGNNPSVGVAPSCVKPWLLPNFDPTTGSTIFDKTTGAITNPSLLGWTSTAANPLTNVCPFGTSCGATTPVAWKFYPGDTTTTFQPPAEFPSYIPALNTAYEQSIAGCVQVAIACNDNANVNIDFNAYNTRNRETAEAVNAVTHATNGGGGDTVTSANPPTAPFEFVAGANNPIAGTPTNYVIVSDSLVTVPVYDSGNNTQAPTNPVQVIGFVQLFLNPDGIATPTNGPNRGKVKTTVINLAGCGTSALTPILGNGASPVAVRLISP